MENVPMKVQTKTLAFTDPTGVVNDCKLEKLEKFITGKIQKLEKFITGETSVIAFRATALKNGRSGNAHYNYIPGICFRKLFSFVKLICIS